MTILKPTLISLTNELIDLQKLLEESGGELPLELEIRMSEVLAEDSKKILSYTNVLNSYEQEIVYVKARIQEAKEYIQRLEKMQEKLLGIAKKAIDMRGGERLVGEMGRCIFLRKSTFVEVNCEATDLPIEAQRISVEPDKTVLKALLQEGAEIPGCRLVEKTNPVWK